MTREDFYSKPMDEQARMYREKLMGLPDEERRAHLAWAAPIVYLILKHGGRFTPTECKAFCAYFDKSFAYLFSDDGEEPSTTN